MIQVWNHLYFSPSPIQSTRISEIVYCYVTVLGKILYRANIGGFEPGGHRIFDDGRDCYAKNWMILTHPFIEANPRIPMKGFQGFRYTKLLFWNMRNIEPGEKICDHCKKNPGPDPRNKILWNGFYDKDTDQLVCWKCRIIHYRKKWKTKFKYLYTEFPVYAN